MRITPGIGASGSPPVEGGARHGRLRQYQLQLHERVQAARSGALAGRKDLGVLLGGRHCLLDLTQLGEIVIPAGLHIQGVPLAQDWYLGLAAMRGRLTAIIDLARYMGQPACAVKGDSRLITFAPRLGLDCAVLVERVLGLRQQRDSEHQHWLRLDLAQLAQAERFLDAGFAGALGGPQIAHTHKELR